MDNKSDTDEQRRVTAVTKRKRRPPLYEVEVDGEPAAEVTEELLVRYRILPGRTVTAAECRMWAEEGAKSVAYHAAISWLAARPRATGELERRLRAKQYDTETIRYVIDKCTKQGYLNDRELAHSMVEQRLRNQRMGRLRVKEELRHKGIADIHIEAALHRFAEEDEEGEWERALAVGSKKWAARYKSPEEQKRRTGMYLLRRGFEHTLVMRVLDHLQAVEPWSNADDI